MAFLRIKLLEAIIDRGKPNEPFCAVNIKEAVSSGDGSVTLQQKKKTFYPDWDRCFDSHIHSGRRMQIIIMDRLEGGSTAPVAEVTVETEALAQECVDEESGSAVKLAVSCSLAWPYMIDDWYVTGGNCRRRDDMRALPRVLTKFESLS